MLQDSRLMIMSPIHTCGSTLKKNPSLLLILFGDRNTPKRQSCEIQLQIPNIYNFDLEPVYPSIPLQCGTKK